MAAAEAAPWRRVGRAVLALALVSYPVLIWFGHTHWSPRSLALVLLGVLVPAALPSLRGTRDARRGLALLPLVTVAALAAAAALDSIGFVLMVPVAINVVLLLGFGATLRPGSAPMIERFARLKGNALTAPQRDWCRAWTAIWCGFFVVNGCTALGLAVAAPLSWWAAYTGLISYALIGVLFATEWFLRHRRFPNVQAPPAGTRDLVWTEPTTQTSERETTHVFRTTVPEDYAFFAGHFPAYPVLAGAVQLHELVLPCLRRAYPAAGAPTGMRGLKFPSRIAPGDEIAVRLARQAASSDVRFAISRQDATCALGTLTFSPRAAGATR